MSSKTAKTLHRIQKHGAFRCFSPTFKRSVFEKGLFRQPQWLALAAWWENQPTKRKNAFAWSCFFGAAHHQVRCTSGERRSSSFPKETEAQWEYTAHGRHISRTKQWRWAVYALPCCTLVSGPIDPSTGGVTPWRQ